MRSITSIGPGRFTKLGILAALDGAFPWAAPAEMVEGIGRITVRIHLKLWRRVFWWLASRDRDVARMVLRESVAAHVVWDLEG